MRSASYVDAEERHAWVVHEVGPRRIIVVAERAVLLGSAAALSLADYLLVPAAWGSVALLQLGLLVVYTNDHYCDPHLSVAWDAAAVIVYLVLLAVKVQKGDKHIVNIAMPPIAAAFHLLTLAQDGMWIVRVRSKLRSRVKPWPGGGGYAVIGEESRAQGNDPSLHYTSPAFQPRRHTATPELAATIATPITPAQEAAGERGRAMSATGARAGRRPGSVELRFAQSESRRPSVAQNDRLTLEEAPSELLQTVSAMTMDTLPASGTYESREESRPPQTQRPRRRIRSGVVLLRRLQDWWWSMVTMASSSPLRFSLHRWSEDTRAAAARRAALRHQRQRPGGWGSSTAARIRAAKLRLRASRRSRPLASVGEDSISSESGPSRHFQTEEQYRQTKPAQTQPAQIWPSQEQPSQTQSAETRPAPNRAAQKRPRHNRQAQMRSSQPQPSQTQSLPRSSSSNRTDSRKVKRRNT